MSQEKKAAAMQTPPYTDSPGVQMQMPQSTPGIPAQAPYAMQAQSPYPTPGGYAPMQSHSAYPTPDGYAPMQAPYGTPNMGAKGPIAMQPMGRPSMVLDAGMPRDANGEREWKHKMCGCTDACGFCLLAWCCPCFAYGNVRSRYQYLLNNPGRPHPQGGDSCDGSAWLYAAVQCFTGCGPILQIMSRGDIRGRYRISGNGCSDCMVACCCAPCELTQEHLELQEEENTLRGQPV